MTENDFAEGVGAHEFVGALVEHWPDVLRLTPTEGLPLLTTRVITAREAAINGRLSTFAAVDDLMYLLRDWLPDEHPVLMAMAQPGYVTVASDDMSRLAGHLAALPVPVPIALPETPPSAPPPKAGREGQEIHHRLLSAPCYTEDQVRQLGVRPDRDDLISLPVTDGESRLPVFQFGDDGQPIPIVTEVNRLLDAADDPWGVADWWLSENVWLRGVPAELRGRVADVYLLQAARAVRPDLDDETGDEQNAPPGPGEE
jgi:hypothetical protein